eukprot:10992623-Alexandrium_andersonii.AAC.1
MGQNWEKTSLTIQRRLLKTKEQKALFGYRKRRDIVKMYPEDKATKMIEKRRKAGKFWRDPEFPQDDDEDFYWVRMNVDVAHTMTIEDGMQLQG